MRLSPIFLAVLSTSPLAFSATTPHVVHERREVSPGWIKLDRIPGNTALPVRIGLAQSNLDQGYAMLMDISNPASSNYANHLSEGDVDELFAPAVNTVQETREWLISSGITSARIRQSANKGWLTFVASVKEMEELLQTEFCGYMHLGTGKKTVACDGYKLPSHISKHVDFVTPGIRLSQPTRTLRKPQPVSKTIEKRELPTETLSPTEVKSFDLTSCDKIVTPACIQKLYKYPDAPCAQPGNQLTILSGNNTYNQSDMDLFFANAVPKIPVGTHANDVNYNGTQVVEDIVESPASIGALEVNLDFQMAWPIVYPQNITGLNVFYGNATTESTVDPALLKNLTALAEVSTIALAALYDTVLEAIDPSSCEGLNVKCGMVERPNVLSLSQGQSETLLPAREATRLCHEFLKLGLQGTSVIVASGDLGATSRVVQPSGQIAEYCGGPKANVFDPIFPGACPFVTTVGGTTIPPGHATDDSAVLEKSVKNGTEIIEIASGGGFSHTFPRPQYQEDAVEAYLHANPPPFPSYDGTRQPLGADGGVFNRAGRGFPDVAAIANRILIAYQGFFQYSGGTSHSAPIVAGLVARINDERLAAGKRPVGFLNPVLYANPHAFNDVKNGTNPGCGTQGFKAAKGWDPVTGLGTVDYPKLRDVFMKLP